MSIEDEEEYKKRALQARDHIFSYLKVNNFSDNQTIDILMQSLCAFSYCKNFDENSIIEVMKFWFKNARKIESGE